MFSLAATVMAVMLALLVCRYAFPMPINAQVVNVTKSGTNASVAIAVGKPEMPICETDDEYDKQVKTIQKYLLIGYFILIFIVVILCCTVTKRKSVKYIPILWVGSFGVQQKKHLSRGRNPSSKLFACTICASYDSRLVDNNN